MEFVLVESAEEVLARALEPRPAASDKQEEVRQLVNL